MSHKNRVTLTCRVCRKRFEVAASRAGRRKTCGAECKREHYRQQMIGNDRAVGNRPNATAFKSGLKPWNKGKRVRLSPATEFKKGQAANNRLPLGSVTTRPDKSGHPRAWVKVAEPNVWRPRAVVVWEQRFGAVPPGCVIHHRDRDTLNDHIDNLSCLTRQAHMDEHRND